MDEVIAVEKTETKYTKEQLRASKRYASKKDVIGVILDDDKMYSFDEVDRLIMKFMKGKVK